jgi:hypothetical protein
MPRDAKRVIPRDWPIRVSVCIDYLSWIVFLDFLERPESIQPWESETFNMRSQPDLHSTKRLDMQRCGLVYMMQLAKIYECTVYDSNSVGEWLDSNFR